MNPGDPGLETWPNLDAARHGGGQVWIPGSYDPETKLYIFGTGNPTPGYTGVGRKGDNLFTCSLIAVNVDTGKMAWYFQTSPHDTHDWDSTQTPVLIDGVINGRQRKLVSTAERNGYFYTLDRVTGEHIVTAKYGSTTNLGQERPSKRRRGTGSAERSHDSRIAGISGRKRRDELAASAYSPDTGLFFVPEHNGFNMLYLTDPDPRGSMGLGGKSVAGSVRLAIFDRHRLQNRPHRLAKTDQWRRVGAGLLATAGGLLFAGDGSGDLMALDSRDGKPFGTRASATRRMRRKHICSMGVSIF